MTKSAMAKVVRRAAIEASFESIALTVCVPVVDRTQRMEALLPRCVPDCKVDPFVTKHELLLEEGNLVGSTRPRASGG